VVPAGFREDLFHDDAASPREPRSLLYVGKYSHAKGLPQLLDAFERLDDIHLHVAGDGSGDEAEALRARMTGMNSVTLHGQVNQSRLAELMRGAEICVLPSYYEGVPLVLVEAAACGCKVVATDLPGVVEQIVPVLGRKLTLVESPEMDGIDTPLEKALPAFVDRLAAALKTSLESAGRPVDVTALGWGSIFARVESIWTQLAASRNR
jgi:glycosyltransferase involved in cell wall biosynthesis